MTPVSPCPVPESSVLAHQAADPDHYADCYTVDLPCEADLSAYLTAFFTLPIMRLERWVITVMGTPSTAQDVAALASGAADSLSLWQVEQRTDDQIAMRVSGGLIRTWLMREDIANGTRLYFGSSVEPIEKPDGSKSHGWGVKAFGGFHQLYSRILLAGAARRLKRIKS